MAGASKTAEQDSRRIAEASREKVWEKPSFLKDLFLGNLRLDYLSSDFERKDRPEFVEFYRELKDFLTREVDSVAIDETGEYPQQVISQLVELGAFGMKIPKEYGGLGLSLLEYSKVMELLGGLDGNLSALLSSHQSIGVPQPVRLFGSEELRREYLPRCAAGEISAFALTEPGVGSDPARLATTATRSEDGEAYILNGEKLWCTNGTLAALLVVMARHEDTGKISAFVVETAWEGVRVTHRCRFMGLKALANAKLEFRNVRVPGKNLIGREGQGLRIALTTLNDGRLSIPNGCVGAAKRCLRICREWARERVQWGKPIGKHEAVAHRISRIAATTFSMQSVARAATEMAQSGGFDIRLEAAAAKEWNSARGWEIVDSTLQVRGGRGYETEASLAGRGEPAVGVERMMRDFRINLIVEGSSEIMHLFMAREAVDKHLSVAGSLVDPSKTLFQKLATVPGVVAFYAWWYPSRWIGWSLWPRYRSFGLVAKHLRFVQRRSRKLARQIFHGIVVFGPGLEKRQAFLFRLVDIATELFAMSASITRANALVDEGAAQGQHGLAMADVFCRKSRRRVNRYFHELWHNDDPLETSHARDVLDDKHLWLEAGLIEKGFQSLTQEASRSAAGTVEAGHRKTVKVTGKAS